MLIFLDSTPLGMVTNPNASPENDECSRWFEGLLAKGVTFRVPEIADYEIRRELLRANKQRGLRRLDGLKNTIGYVELTTDTMLKAAELWAWVRNRGLPTADEKALDGDVILAAQARLTSADRDQIIIATQNVSHLSRFDTATVISKEWRDIS
jgi:predicted nucleic acid-binding protein